MELVALLMRRQSEDWKANMAAEAPDIRSDAELLSLSLAGDEPAFLELYRKLKDGILCSEIHFKATILTKHNDPWSGELKTQFRNVNTSEPDSSLFTVPSDYKIVDEKIGTFTVKLPPPSE